jgi:hypothetical protein
MYSNGGSRPSAEREKRLGKLWQDSLANQRQAIRNGKCFVRCICPKCTDRHDVYMLWAGRGVPRKYCSSCKPMISGYDDAARYEASISAPGLCKKNGRPHEAE